MFGLEILDVVIGLFFGYLVLSLGVTAANELFAAWFRRRAWMLRLGVESLLNGAQVQEFYTHPLIQSLQRKGRHPSYIPSRTFAMALLDIAAPLTEDTRAIPPRNSPDAVSRTLALLWAEARGNDKRFVKSVETWFNDAMERVGGWYRRRTQLFVLLWAAVMTVSTNADTIVITRALWRDPALREAVVARAERYVAEQPRPQAQAEAQPAGDAPPPPPLPPDQQAEVDFQDASAQFDAALADLAELQLPIGWEVPASGTAGGGQVELRLVRDDATDDWPGPIWTRDGLARWRRAFADHLIGWLITMLAVSLGAPFWFDTLNRIMSIRGAGRSPLEEKKPQKKVG